MENEELVSNSDVVRPLPDRPPRYCPACGARVAEGAKTCLMCGASLEETFEVEEAPQITVARQLGRKQVLILGVIALVLLGASTLLGWKLSQGQVLAPSPTPTTTPTPLPTSTPTLPPTPTSAPTNTPLPSPTPTAMPPQVYTVQPGDTLLEIALEHDMTVEELMAYNSLESDIIVEGQALLLPPPTPTPGPTPTLKPGEPTATPAPFILYTVKPGDTLSTIAEEFGVSLRDLRMANDIPPDSETIRDGQVLQIPRYTPTPTPEASQWLIASGTPTPRSAYSAPMPIYPPDNATFTGPDALVILQWTSSGILEDNAYYRVELSVPTVDGPTKTYFYQQSTALRLPTELFPTADVEERVCVWHVDVVQTQSEADTLTDQPAEAYKAMSPKSESRTFFWEVPSS